MSYKFEKAAVYYDQKRFLELSAEVFKIAFDIPEDQFQKVRDHDINSTYHSCSVTLNKDDLIYHITDDIVITIEERDDGEHIKIGYGLYVCTDDFGDFGDGDCCQYKWYLISYVQNVDIVSFIDFSGNEIKYNKNDNYIEYRSSYVDETNNFIAEYPFTKDVYFNYLMSKKIDGITYEVLNALLELKFPEGYHGCFYDY